MKKIQNGCIFLVLVLFGALALQLIIESRWWWNPAPFWKLHVTLDLPEADTAQLFYDTGKGYNGEETQTHSLMPGTQTFVLNFPENSKVPLRFDPVREGRSTPLILRFYEIAFTNPEGLGREIIPLQVIQPLLDCETKLSADGSSLTPYLEVKIPINARDPQLSLPIPQSLLAKQFSPSLDSRNIAWGRNVFSTQVSTSGVMLVTLSLLGLVVSSLGLTLCPDCRFRNLIVSPAAWALTGVFLVSAGLKLYFIQRFGSEIPYWDQWLADGDLLYRRFLEGGLTWRHLVDPHNEHRILLTRLTNLVLLILDGFWNVKTQMAWNAFFQPCIAVLLGGIFWRLGREYFFPWVPLGLIAVFALPFCWENTLVGFQSQVYYSEFFFILTLWLVAFQPVASTSWWAGCLLGVAGLFTTASGFFGGIIIAVLSLMRLIRKSNPQAGTGWTLLYAFLLVGLGGLLHVKIPGHSALQAETFSVWLEVVHKGLAWPFETGSTPAVWIWLPMGVFVFLYFRKSQSPRFPVRLVEFLFGLTGWVWMIAMSIAFARGSGGADLSNRYFDLLALGSLVVFVSWPLLFSLTSYPAINFLRFILKVAVPGSLLWWGILPLAQKDIRENGPVRRHQAGVWKKEIMAYWKEHHSEMLSQLPMGQRAFPYPTLLASFLDNPITVRILPFGSSLEQKSNDRVQLTFPCEPFLPVGSLSRWTKVIVYCGKFITWAGLFFLAGSFFYLAQEFRNRPKNTMAPRSP